MSPQHFVEWLHYALAEYTGDPERPFHGDLVESVEIIDVRTVGVAMMDGTRFILGIEAVDG